MADVLHRTTKQLLLSVNTPDYSTADWIRNPDLSAVSAVPTIYWKITGDVVSEMNQSEKDTEDASSLGALKISRYAEIDSRTAELIAVGFEYPVSSGDIFSLSLEGQSNIHGAYTSRNLTEFTYPVKWLTKDDGSSISLTDAAAIEDFFLGALSTIRGHKDSGSDLKEQIRNAATKAAVDALVDTR